MSDLVNCANCGKLIKQSDARMGQPVIKVGELLRAFKTPALLSGELPDVPYCAECRPLVAKQRTNEQLKFLGMILAVLLIIVVIVFVVL